MKTIKTYECFNQRRYSNPWVAIVGEDAKINFSKKVGGYTGAYGKGEAGELYIIEPVENAVYAYGQKDYRGSNTELAYIQYRNGQFVPVEKTELIAVLSGAAPEAAAEEEQPAPTEKEPEQAVEPESEKDNEGVEEPDGEEEGETKESAPDEQANVRGLCNARHTILPNILLHDLGGNVAAIFDRWQQRYDAHPGDGDKTLRKLFEDPDGISSTDAADGAYYEIVREIRRLYFSRIDRAAAQVILMALGADGSIDLITDNPDLHFNSSSFRDAWNAVHPDAKLF